MPLSPPPLGRNDQFVALVDQVLGEAHSFTVRNCDRNPAVSAHIRRFLNIRMLNERRLLIRRALYGENITSVARAGEHLSANLPRHVAPGIVLDSALFCQTVSPDSREGL